MATVHITSAFGYLETDNGGSFDLDGSYFVRSFPARYGPSFDIADLPNHLRGLKVTSIDHRGSLGSEAVTVISVHDENHGDRELSFQEPGSINTWLAQTDL